MKKVFQNNAFFDELTEKIKFNGFIELEYYDKYRVKRGLRNENGTGVLVGLTRVGSVEGYILENGHKIPAEGELYYRGININDMVAGFQKENSSIFE